MLREYAIPLAIATALPSCATEVSELQHPTIASASPVATQVQLYNLDKQTTEQSICDKGNETWTAVSDTLSCQSLTPDTLKAKALSDANSFLVRVKNLFANSKVTPIANPLSSSEFVPNSYSLEDSSGGKHVFELFDGEYEAIVYLYLNATYDDKIGYSGTETYSFSLSANSFDFYHFENGDGCIKCGNPNLKVKDPSNCARETNSAIYPDGVYNIDVFAATKAETGSYPLKCLASNAISQTIESVCAEYKSEADAKCSVDQDNQKIQVLNLRSPLSPKSSQLDIDQLFLTLKNFMATQGYDLQPFEK